MSGKRLPPKEITCDCGNRMFLERETDWCDKCVSRVFYNEKDKKRNALNKWYYFVILLGVITFLAYFFIEMILTPVLNM